MKLEFLDKINKDGDSIIRLFDFDATQANKFRQTIQQTLIDTKTQLDLAAVDFVDAINCNLIFRIADTDKGITTQDAKVFYCDLTTDNYTQMTHLLEPFRNKGQNGYQWLYDIDTPIDLLFSPTGNW